MEALALGLAAFDPSMGPLELLEAGAVLYSRGEMKESERFDELAADLAEIRSLPERKASHA